MASPVRFPIVGPAYTTRSLDQSCQRLVNWYLEVTEKGGTTEMALYPTPGLRLLMTAGDGPVRSAMVFGAYLYVVSGAGVYKIDRALTATLLGSIGTSTGYAPISCNGLEALIVDGSGGYLITIADATFARIDDPDFPAGVTWCDFLDSYFIVGGDGSQSFYISGLLAGGEWNGTDFASAEGDPDPLIRGIVTQRQLFLFGGNSTEVWQNTGNATFPIERADNVFLEAGIAAVASAAKLDNSIMWLGQDARGDGIVFRAEGYTPVRISTHAIEHAIREYDKIDDAIAYTYQQEGHSFFVLNFPSADTTWTYDVATQTWHERAWFDAATGLLHRHRGNVFAFFNRQSVVGDWENGKLYVLDLNVYTDDGLPTKRVRTTFNQDAQLRKVFYGSLEIDIEHGVGPAGAPLDYDPKIVLRLSKDRGHVWGNRHTRSMGKVGQYGSRCKFDRLGSARGMVFEISVTEDVKAVILGGVVLGQAGTS